MKKAFLLIGFLILIVSCNNSTDKRAQLDKLKKEHDQISAEIIKLENELNPEGTAALRMVMIDTLKKGPFSHFIEVQGRIDGNDNIAVSPRSPGVVNKILVKEGDHVTKGQVLAELDAEVVKQQLNDLKSQLDFATDLYNKQKELWDQKIGSEVQYLTAKNTMETLQNKINIVEDQVKMSNITAPIDGTIEEIPIKVGQMAAAGATPAFRIVNFSKAKAVADVGEAYTAKIKTGDQVNVFLPDLNQELTETVTFSSKYINPTNRTFVVEAAMPSSDNSYRANMIAVLKIKDYYNPMVISIPQDYIQTSMNEGKFVFVTVMENGKKVARKKFITSGNTYNGLTEILTGLSEGDLIITSGYKDLYDGQVIDYK
jgi:membrane fusion protein, multidrug efflux system